MNYSESLAARVRGLLAESPGIGEKRMFGGIGFFLDGNLLVAVWKDLLIARLGPEEADVALKEPHTRVMDITGRVMRGWVMVAPEGVERDPALRAWLERALKFVVTLPAK